MSNLTVSTDKSRLDINAIHAYLKNSYWAGGRTIEAIQKSIEHSFCFGAYFGDELVGFARTVSDQTIFAYIMDVYIVDEHQGKGYGKELMYAIMNHAELRDAENWFLRTMDAHGLYQQFGFEELAFPERTMAKKKKNR